MEIPWIELADEVATILIDDAIERAPYKGIKLDCEQLRTARQQFRRWLYSIRPAAACLD